MNTKRWIAIVIFIVLLISFSTSSADTWNTTWPGGDSGWQEDIYQQGLGDKLVLIDVDGIILAGQEEDFFSTPTYDHQVFLSQIEHAFSSSDVKGVILRVNSPGGAVSELDEIYFKMNELREKYPKPMVVYMDRVAASGGYYIATPADKIFANRNTITGSIGVILGNYNYYQLAENLGIKDQTFKSGTHKDILNPMREMTQEEERIIQELVDESYGFFVDAIVESRGMDRARVIELADGRIYSGQQAVNNGLIDEIGFLEQAISATAELASIDDPQVVRYTRNDIFKLNNFLSGLKNPSFNQLEYFISNKREPSLMYLWNW